MTPTVTIVVPTLDERARITDCLASLSAQDHPGIVEILVVDGGSTDGTADLVSLATRRDPRIRLLANPERSAAAALNVGLAAATGDLFVRADAHSTYAPDYVRRCVEVLAETAADDVGGPMRPIGLRRFGRAVAAVTSSPWGMGSAAFHYATRRCEVDTVYLGCYRTATLRRLGGWDATRLQWGAEDHELNFRLRQRGGRIVCDPSIRSWYSPRESPGALWRQYRNYGIGKVSTLAKHRRLPTLRPLAPTLLVAILAGSVLFASSRRSGPLLTPVALWIGALAVLSGRLASPPDVTRRHAFAAAALIQLAYGTGVVTGLARRAVGLPFRAAATDRR